MFCWTRQTFGTSQKQGGELQPGLSDNPTPISASLSITLDFQCDIQFAVNAITPLDLSFFMFQAKLPEESFPGSPDKIVHNQNVNIPPATHLIADLEPHSLYAVRVACHSSQGSSDWSPWVEFRTKQGGEAAKCGGVVLLLCGV